MLVDVSEPEHYSDIALVILQCQTDHLHRFDKGCYIITHFNGEYLLGKELPLNQSYPELPGSLNSYGVCDTPYQFLTYEKDLLENDPRPFIIFFTHIEKDPENKGKGGGWRWHKWGPYVGEHTPTKEYLDDEDGFEDGVYVYHILDVTGLNYKA